MPKRRTGLVASLAVVVVLLAFGSLARADSGGTTGLGFDDAYTQIVNHEIPVQPDGKPTYFSGGRHYLGPNGWEIRLNHRATMHIVAVANEVAVEGTSSVTVSALGAVATAIGPEAGIGAVIVSAVESKAFEAVSHVVTGVVDYIKVTPAVDAAFQNRCLGITIPQQALPHLFHRVNLLLGNQLLQFLNEPSYNDIKIWFENCAPGDKSQADIALPPPPPPAQPADLAPAQPAVPLPPPSPPVQQRPQPPAAAPPLPAPPVQVPPAPAPSTIQIDFAAACHWHFGNASGATTGDTYSIQCLDAAGNALGGFQDGTGYSLNDWCATRGYFQAELQGSSWICRH